MIARRGNMVDQFTGTAEMSLYIPHLVNQLHVAGLKRIKGEETVRKSQTREIKSDPLSVYFSSLNLNSLTPHITV